MSATRQFAAFIANTRYEDLPPEVVGMVKRDLLDTLAVMLAATSADKIADLRCLAETLGGAPEEVSVYGFDCRLPICQAVLVNAAAAFFLDYDDVCLFTGHVGCTAVPTALAVAQRQGGISGKALITACAVAMETVIRLGMGIDMSARNPKDFAGGWDITQTHGVFTAAVIAAKLMGLDEDRIIDALGIAYSGSSGQQIGAREGADTKVLAAAFAARHGILSALMAQAGLRGPASVFTEHPLSLAGLYYGGRFDERVLTDGLGSSWHLDHMCFKLWPSCGHTHYYLYTILEMVKKHGIRPEEIQSVSLEACPMVMPMLEHTDRNLRPQDRQSCVFNVLWNAACALIRGQVTISEHDEDARNDPAIQAMARRVHAVLRDDLTSTADPCAVTIITDRGTFTGTTVTPPGYFARPIPEDLLMDKYLDCVAHARKPYTHQQAIEFRELIGRLESLADVRPVIDFLA